MVLPQGRNRYSCRTVCAVYCGYFFRCFFRKLGTLINFSFKEELKTHRTRFPEKRGLPKCKNIAKGLNVCAVIAWVLVLIGVLIVLVPMLE
jgi:hypothetical protein